MPRVKVEVPRGESPGPDETEEATQNPNIQQYFYKPEEIKKLVDDPDYHLKYRKQIEYAINTGFEMFYKDSEAQKMAKRYMEMGMAARLKNHPELTKRLIPTWPVGCR